MTKKIGYVHNRDKACTHLKSIKTESYRCLADTNNLIYK